MGELVDLELLVLQLVVLAGNAFDQAGGKFAQLLRIHRGELIRHGHALDGATATRNAVQPFHATRIVACAPMRHHGNPINSACNCSWLIATAYPIRHSPR